MGAKREGSNATLGGLLLFGSAVFTFAVLSSVLRRPDLIADNNISEFGVHAPTAFAFNAGLIACGLATLLAAGLWHGGGARTSTILSIVAGCGMIGAGLVTIHVARLPHAILAGFDYSGHLLLTVTLASLAVGTRRWLGFATAGISIVFLLLWALGTPFLFETIGQGGAQLLAILPLVAWMIWFSTDLLLAAARSAIPSDWTRHGRTTAGGDRRDASIRAVRAGH